MLKIFYGFIQGEICEVFLLEKNYVFNYFLKKHLFDKGNNKMLFIDYLSKFIIIFLRK